MFRPHKLGDIFQNENLTVFFGNRDSKTDEYRKIFSQNYFFRLKQIHSDVVHSVDKSQQDWTLEGDATVTSEKNFAICSISADCMPVFIYNKPREMIAAIHAGWRGIAKRIIPKTIDLMKSKGADPKENVYFIGPHIMKNSFEVDNQVRDEILKSVATAPIQGISEPISDAKSIVDLLAIAEIQIKEFSPDSSIIKHVFDTKTDSRYHSFRRDRENSGRQVSFICLS